MDHYNEKIADWLKSFMAVNHYPYLFDEEHGIFSQTLEFNGKLKYVNMYISVRENSFSPIATLTTYADTENLHQMRDLAEFIARLNNKTLPGYFSINFESGSISYKYLYECASELPSYAHINEILSLPLQMVMHFGVGFLSVMKGEQSPAEAVEFCEQLMFYELEENPAEGEKGGEVDGERRDEHSGEMEDDPPEEMEIGSPDLFEADSPDPSQADYPDLSQDDYPDLSETYSPDDPWSEEMYTEEVQEQEPEGEKEESSLEGVLHLIRKLQQ